MLASGGGRALPATRSERLPKLAIRDVHPTVAEVPVPEQRLRFVIADDSSIPRDILHRVLRNGGYEVVAAATNGLQAIEFCNKHKPDVAILDVSMPGMQGTEAGRIITEQKLARKVIFASSAGQAVVTNQMAAMGATFVSKPYNAEIFLKALNAVLAGLDDL
jgi:response regulator NasT